MKSLTVTQRDKSEFTFQVGDKVQITDGPTVYCDKFEDYEIEFLSKHGIRIKGSNGSGTVINSRFLRLMKFEKVA